MFHSFKKILSGLYVTEKQIRKSDNKYQFNVIIYIENLDLKPKPELRTPKRPNSDMFSFTPLTEAVPPKCWAHYLKNTLKP